MIAHARAHSLDRRPAGRARLLLGMTLVAGLNFGCNPAKSGGEDVFPFSRKSKNVDAVPTVIHERLHAELVPERELPGVSPVGTPLRGACERMRLTTRAAGAPLTAFETGTEVSQMAFVVRKVPNLDPFAIVNDSAGRRVELWPLAPDALELRGKPDPVSFGVDQSRWVTCSVLDATALPGQRLLVAVSYHDPRPRYALYVYELLHRRFAHLADVAPDARDLSRLFDQRIIRDHEHLVLYYSDTRRKSAEIYHNYYNHLVLFARERPGLEILKLGIDVGNVRAWGVVGRKLYLETIDNRDHSNPRVGHWSLDLRKVLEE
ncbi:MAG: hypothetical protein AB7O52_07055 [Planctomycetota bacterium]